MNETKALLEEFEKYWNISLNGDYRYGYKLTSIAKTLKDISSKPNFDKSILSLSEQITLSHALIVVNIKLS